MSFCSHCGNKLLASSPPHCTKCHTPQYQNPTPVAVSVTPVLNKEGSVMGLVGVKRSQTTGLGAGKWALPGGYVDLGETAQKASLRELFEETSLVPPKMGEKVIDSAISSNGKTLLVFVQTQPVTHEQLLSAKVSDECEQCGLLTPDMELAFSSHTEVMLQFFETLKGTALEEALEKSPESIPSITAHKPFS